MRYKYNHGAFRETRKKLGLKQRELAMIFGCTESALRNYETGRQSPNGYIIEMLYLLCEKKGVARPRVYDLPEDPLSLLPEWRRDCRDEQRP